jgi:hypothetical protein
LRQFDYYNRDDSTPPNSPSFVPNDTEIGNQRKRKRAGLKPVYKRPIRTESTRLALPSPLGLSEDNFRSKNGSEAQVVDHQTMRSLRGDSIRSYIAHEKHLMLSDLVVSEPAPYCSEDCC